MSIIYKNTKDITVPQIVRIGEVKNILAKFGVKFAERSVHPDYDFGLIALFKKHPSNVARVEYPQLVVNHVVVGNLAEVKAAYENGKLQQIIGSLPAEAQNEIVLDASCFEETKKEQVLQSEIEKRKLEEERRILEARKQLHEEKLRKEKEKEESIRKEREERMRKKKEEEREAREQTQLYVSRIQEQLIVTQQKEIEKKKQKSEFAQLINEDEAAVNALPIPLQEMVNQIHAILPQLYKRTIIPICSKFPEFTDVIDYILLNQEELEAGQQQFSLIETEQNEFVAPFNENQQESLLMSSICFDEPISVPNGDLAQKNAALESENEQLKEQLTKFKFQQLQVLVVIRDETRRELERLEKLYERQKEELEMTSQFIDINTRKLELLDNQVIELSATTIL